MVYTDYQQHIWIWLMVCVYLPSAIESETRGHLNVFLGTRNVTEAVFLDGTNDCLVSFNESDLPKNITGLTVEKPSELSVALFNSEDGFTLNPGASIQWKSPESGASQCLIKGFYVTFGNKTVTRCWIFLINHTYFEDILDFDLTLWNITDKNDIFSITVYSLPLNNHRTRIPINRLSTRIATPGPTDIASPGRWAPSFSFNSSLKNGTVDVVFNLPPKVKGWNLTHFQVTLNRTCSPVNVNDAVLIIKEKDTNDTEEHVQFKGLDDDCYRLLVHVHNQGFLDNDNLCICKIMDSCYPSCSSYDCNPSCESLRSVWFDLKGDECSRGDLRSSEKVSCKANTPRPSLETIPSVKTTPSREITTEMAVLTETSQGSPTGKVNGGLNAEEIAGIVVVIVVVFVVILIISLIYHHSQKPPEYIDRSTRKPDKGIMITVPNVSDIKRKSVYLVATSDHDESKLLIKTFCGLLETHCHCDVINPSDAYSNQTSENVWVAREINRSDSVLIVNSKGAEKLIDAKLSKQKEVIEDLNHSMFMKALQIAFNSSTKKFLIVSFSNDFISDKLAILEPKKFLLPKQMSSFLCTIHNLSENEAEKFKSQLPFDGTCLPNIPGGQDFINAIRDVEHFEKNRAKWFDENYSLTRSAIGTADKCERDSTASSRSSGCSSCGQDTMSVSMTDLSLLTDSPTFASTETTSLEAPASPDDGIGLDEITFSQEGSSEILSACTDFRSYATVGKSSDGPCLAVNDHTVKQTNTSSASRHLQINPPQSSYCSKGIVPPRANISTDNASNIIANNNDALSMWSTSL